MKGRPPIIEEWMRKGEKEKLAKAGKKGGDVNAIRRDVFSVQERERREQEDWKHKVEANEHIYNPDGMPADPDERQPHWEEETK